MANKERFLKTYANLPISERSMPIYIESYPWGDEPMSWRVCYLEIEHHTSLGDKILEQLEKLKII